MTDPIDERLKRARVYIEKLKTTRENKRLFFDFYKQLAGGVKPLSQVRQDKYLYAFSTIVELLPIDFRQVTKKDIERFCIGVNTLTTSKGKRYSEWSRRDLKIIIKRLVKFIRESEGQEFEKQQYPKEVSCIEINIDRKTTNYKKKHLDWDDIVKMARVANNLRDKAFVQFLYESGARIGEVLSVQIKDVTFKQSYAEVQLPVSKTKPRPVYVSRSAPALSQWLHEHPKAGDPEAFLFCGLWSKKKGDGINYQTFRFMLQGLATRAGVKKPVNPHHFRHSRATELAHSPDLTNAQLCQLMGWVQGSRELKTYINDVDTEKAMRKMFGIEDKEEEKKQQKIIVCPRCGTENSPGSEFCFNCRLGLDDNAVLKYEAASKELLKQTEDIKTQNDLAEVVASLQDEVRELKEQIRKKNQK